MAKRIIKKNFTEAILVKPEDNIVIKKGVVGNADNSGIATDNSQGLGSMDGARLQIDGKIVVSKAGPISSAIWSNTDTTGLTIDIGKTGVLKAGLYGIHHGGPGLVVDNAGLIQANVGIGGEMRNADITNSGSIIGVAAGVDWAKAVEGGQLVNSGLIKATKGAAVNIEQFLDAASFSIVNYGTLDGGGKVGKAISVMAATEMLDIVNTGTIKGNVDLGFGAAAFENRGTVTGTVTGSLGDTEYRLTTKTNIGQDLGGYDIVYASYSIKLAEGIEDLVLRGKKDLNGTGNDAYNDLKGNVGDNILKGLGGNDTLDGGKGNDRLFGGDGVDTFVYATGYGKDVIEDADATDWIDLSHVLDAFDFASLNAVEKKGNVVVDFDSGNTLTFRDMTLEEFATLQFRFAGLPE
ncbi:calcium-binding protein [Rhizobium sp.]